MCVLGKPNLLSGWKRFSWKSIVWWETYFRGDLIARLSLTDNQLGRRPTVKPSLVTRSHCRWRWLGRPLWDGRLEPWHCFSEVASLEDKLWGEVGAGWWHSSYLSQISQIIFVEKKLSRGEISAFHVWKLWGNWKFLHTWRNFSTINGVLLQFMPFCFLICYSRCFVAKCLPQFTFFHVKKNWAQK